MKRRILPLLTLILITGMSYGQARQIQVTLEDSIVSKVSELYIAGTFNGWKEPGDLMTKVNDSTYTYDFEAADTTGVAFKFLTGPLWAYEQTRTADYRYSTDSITRVSSFKAYYDPNAEPQEVTIEVLVPVEVHILYLTGNFVNWVPDAVEMQKIDSTQDGKVFTATIEVVDSMTLEYKFIAGPGWAYEQTESNNFRYADVGGVVVCDEFKAIFDPANVGDITLNITVPEGTPDVWIIGSFGNWDTTMAVHATQVDETHWTAVIEDVADIEFKVYNHPNWTWEEASDDQGTTVPNRAASFISGPSFDIVVAYWKDIFGGPVTSINDPLNSNIKVYTTRYRTVVAEGVAEKVTIFDLRGRLVQDVRTKGTFQSKALPSGVYIIRVDNYTRKVAIQ